MPSHPEEGIWCRQQGEQGVEGKRILSLFATALSIILDTKSSKPSSPLKTLGNIFSGHGGGNCLLQKPRNTDLGSCLLQIPRNTVIVLLNTKKHSACSFKYQETQGCPSWKKKKEKDKQLIFSNFAESDY